ncbi:15808_t:CDS:2 [Entrophospora sp. SA101]|nr:15808_t:CDS:2 [Entrophospora sp. SA101]
MKDRFIFGDSIRESSENMALEFTKDATQKEFLRENKEFNDVIKPKEVFDTAELDGARSLNILVWEVNNF